MFRRCLRSFVSIALFVAAVVTVYIGGFVYDEVGPGVYALSLAILASTPLLLKISFWKKLVLMLPLLILRVIGKILLKVFGKNALSRLMQRYGLLEQRLATLTHRLQAFRTSAMRRWGRLGRSRRAYLVLIFMPLAVVILFVMLIVRIVRLKFLQMIIEKGMQTGLEKATKKIQKQSAVATEDGSRVSDEGSNRATDVTTDVNAVTKAPDTR